MQVRQALLRSLAGVLVCSWSLAYAEEHDPAHKDCEHSSSAVKHDKMKDSAECEKKRDSAHCNKKTHDGRLSLLQSSKIVGATIQGLNEEKYGTIENLILNPSRNRVCYVVADLDPITDNGDKRYAIPWTLVDFRSGERVAVIDLPKEKLTSAPSFNEDKYPALNDSNWWTQADRHFGQENRMKEAFRRDQMINQRMTRSTTSGTPSPSVSPSQAPTPYTDRDATIGTSGTTGTPNEFASSSAGGSQWGRLISELDNLKVENAVGEDLGEADTYMVDLPSGHITYAIVSFGGVLGVAGDEAAVPWSSFTIRPVEKVARVQTDSETLKAVAFKIGENSDNLTDRAYAERIHSHFRQEPYWEVFGYVGGSSPSHDVRFDPNNIKSIEGTVEGVTDLDGSTTGVGNYQELKLKRDDGEMVCVRLAPRDVLQKNGLSFARGDKIEVKGSMYTSGDKSVLVATEIEKGDQKLQLRDDQGKELFNRSTTVQPTPSDSVR